MAQNCLRFAEEIFDEVARLVEFEVNLARRCTG
jgi:hypothetical protein